MGSLELARRMMRVLVVDGYGYLSEGIRRHLELGQGLSHSDSYDVEGVLTGQEAVRVGRERAPALIFVDLSLPEESGFGLIRRLRTEFVTARLLACSLYDQGWLVARTLAAGGHGYIVKSAGHHEFCRVVDVVLSGGFGVPDSVKMRWMRDWSGRTPLLLCSPHDLSESDLRVVVGMVQGASWAELSTQWGCHESEVVDRYRALQARVGCRTREDWCRCAVAHGLMSDVWAPVPPSASA